MTTINTETWRKYKICNLFEIKRPAARSRMHYDSGEVPFVTSGYYNNGVLTYLSPKNDEELEKGNCISVSPIDGSAFYQPIDFMGRGGAGSSIILLYNNKINKYSGLFIATIIRKAFGKYLYNNMANKVVIATEEILLPSDINGQPDYLFMEMYMKNLEQRTIKNFELIKSVLS